MVGLRDLQDVEIHVQSQAHEGNLNSRLSTSCYATTKGTCELCGVSFHNEISLEAHRLMPLHRNVANLHSFPKLNELLGQLSGLPGEHPALDISSLCSICNVQHDGLDAYIMHLFTTPHISKLRFSSCLVCNKEFIHADSRESHLGGYKHLSNVQKCGDVLKEHPLVKGGYPCMFCMVWCRSWLCLELHLQFTSHADAVRRSKAKHTVSAKINFAMPRDVEDDRDNACDVNAATSWRGWRQSVSTDHAWCHRCGVSLPTLDAANIHSEKHDFEKDRLAMHKTHVHEASDSSSAPVLFDCCVCALSFKNAFLLMAHEASFQHHCRLVKYAVVDDLMCCASCGVLVSNEDGKVNTCKELDVLQSGTEHEPEGLCDNPTKNGSGVDLINIDRCDLDVLELDKNVHDFPAAKGKSCSETVQFAKVIASKETMKDELCAFDPCRVKKERSSMECSNHAAVNPLSFTDGNRDKVKTDSDMMSVQRETGSEGNSSQIKSSHVYVVPKTENAGTALACAKHVENGVLQDTRTPVIAAAALAPLGAFHQSLHSIMTIVVEALSATLPAYAQYSASSSQEKMKRERQKDQEILRVQHEAKRVCSEEDMKETLQHILQSVRSNSASVAMDDKSMDKTEMVVAVAASLIPKFSPDSCGSAGVLQGEGTVVTERQQGCGKGVNEGCEHDEKSIDIEVSLDEGLQEGGGKLRSAGWGVIQNNESRAKKELHQGKDEEEEMVKESRGQEALTMDGGIPAMLIMKSEKDDGIGNDSLGVPNQFKDADLWWVLSDSEDVTQSESNFKLQTYK